MEDDIYQIDEKITRLKKKKEKLQTQCAVLLLKEAQDILGEKFSYELTLSVLSNSWEASSDKQKEEWIKSAQKFRRTPRKSKKSSSSQRESSRRKIDRNENSETTTENS